MASCQLIRIEALGVIWGLEQTGDDGRASDANDFIEMNPLGSRRRFFLLKITNHDLRYWY